MKHKHNSVLSKIRSKLRFNRKSKPKGPTYTYESVKVETKNGEERAFIFKSDGRQLVSPLIVPREDARELISRLNGADPKIAGQVYSRWFTEVAERIAEEDRENEIQRRKDEKLRRKLAKAEDSNN